MERGISTNWIAHLFQHPDLLRMGHGQRADDLNLGLGWLYYALGRIIRPRLAVVVGSWRGFAPIVFAKALQDNLEQGELIFVDPSLADGFWKDKDAVERHFLRFGVANVRHFPMTTQEFVKTESYAALDELGVVFIDGRHTEEQARYDYEAFAPRLAPRGLIALHDSMVVRDDKVYGAENAYKMTVKHFVDQLKEDSSLQVLDLPFGATGLTLVRKLDGDKSRPLDEWLEDPG